MKCKTCKTDLNKLEKLIVNRNTHARKLAKIKRKWNKHVNIFIGNKFTKFHKELFFDKEHTDDGSITLHYKGDPWLTGIMRDIGIFESTSEAKGAGWHKKAKEGFTDEIVIIKKRPHRVCIFKEKVTENKNGNLNI